MYCLIVLPAIRKIKILKLLKLLKVLRLLKDIKTSYAAASYWSALFPCDGDGRTASDQGCFAGVLVDILNRV
jgi:hypothetical protein